MSKKILIGIIAVIILVSLNWFTKALAQDLSTLSDEQKRELLEQYRSGTGTEQSQSKYTTPPIYYEQDSQRVALDGMERGKDMLDAHHQKQQEGSRRVTGEIRPFTDLEPFGMELFRDADGQEMPVDVISTSEYVLGPGDNLIVYLWGRVEKEFSLTIDREGKLFIPQVGSFSVWGLTLEEFIVKAKHQFSTVYSDFDLTVSLGKIRSMRIYVAGEVKRPGAYTVSSLTSLFNALYLAGGPNERGSMRRIKLMRNGKEVTRVDLYKLLLQGDNSTDISLRSGDVVFVPVVGMQVAIRGEVRREALYELKGGETVDSLLELAGNATPLAHLERIMVERVDHGGEWKVLDVNLLDNGDGSSNLTLQAGDKVSVYSIYDMKKNIVSVFGQVKHPGYYERNDSTKVSDLITQGQLQPFDVYKERADLFRRYPDKRVEIIPVELDKIMAGDFSKDLYLQDKDSLHIYSIDEVEWDRYVFVEGEVKNPGRYPLYEHMTVQDLIFLAGSYTREAQRHQAEIARIDSLADIDIIDVPLTREPGLTFQLQEDDHLYIRRIPRWERERSVTITGEVNYPGKYTLANRQETLLDLMKRAGGFTDKAFPRGIILERMSIKDNLRRLRVQDVIEKSTPVKYDSLGQIVEENTVVYDSLSMNRIIIDMDKIIATNGAEGDILLEPFDRIIIPTIPSGISVIGAIGSNGTLKYIPGKKVKDYIERAGNFTRQADKKETRLIKATGEVINRGSILSQRVEVGDVIVVPTKIEKDHNYFKTMTTALSAITGVLTSVYIISKI